MEIAVPFVIKNDRDGQIEVSGKSPSGVRLTAISLISQSQDGQIDYAALRPCGMRFAERMNVLCFTKLGSRTFRCAKEFELADPDNKKASLCREAFLKWSGRPDSN